MTFYILHYASIDEEGRLTIDCQGPFQTPESAKAQQEALMKAFQYKYDYYSDSQIEETCGQFNRVAYNGHLIELQTHIEEIMFTSLANG